jgi:hypothetical protein
MPSPHPNPDPDPDGSWPSCDDPPPGVSIRPLSHADLAALLAHLHQYGHDQDLDDLARPATPAPVVAVRVRASVGRPGASASAKYRRRRATELATWTRTLPRRAAAMLTAGVLAWLLAGQLAAHLAAVAAVAAASAVAWALRFRTSPDTHAWQRGPSASAAPPACSRPWSGTAGRSCTTWPSPARPPTSTTW